MNARRINTYSMAEIDENQRYEEVVAGNVVRRAAAEPSVQPKRKIQKAPLERVSQESQKKRGIFTTGSRKKRLSSRFAGVADTQEDLHNNINII